MRSYETVICIRSGKIHIDDPWSMPYKWDKGWTLCGCAWDLQRNWIKGETTEGSKLHEEYRRNPEGVCYNCLLQAGLV